MERTTGPLLRVSKVWGKKATPGTCVTHLPELPALSLCPFSSRDCTAGACQAFPPHWSLSPGFENHTLMTHMYTPSPHPPPPPSPPARLRGTPQWVPVSPGRCSSTKARAYHCEQGSLGPAPTCPASSPAPGGCAWMRSGVHAGGLLRHHGTSAHLG